MEIESVHAREILDSRGNPTVEVDVTLDDGSFGRAAVPCGASTGVHEALELRDGDAKRYGGKGVLKAVDNVNRDDRAERRRHGRRRPGRRSTSAMIALDGTPNKGEPRRQRHPRRVAGRRARPPRRRLGAAALPLPRRAERAACCRCRCSTSSTAASTPTNSTDFQEFMVMPLGAPTFARRPALGCEIYHALKKVLKEKRPLRRTSATRAASRRRSAATSRRRRGDPRGDRSRRLRAGRRRGHRARPGGQRVLRREAEAVRPRRARAGR